MSDEMRRLRSGGAMPADLAEAFGVSLRTVYRYLGSGPVVRVRLGPWEGSFEVRETDGSGGPALWGDEDGEYGWVEVESCPDQDEAGRAIAESFDLVFTRDGRQTIRTQDCECVPTHGVDPGGEHECFDHPGEACAGRESVDCWQFASWGEPEWVDVRDIVHELGDSPLVYLPERWALADGEIVRKDGTEAGAPAEAPSIEMGLIP